MLGQDATEVSFYKDPGHIRCVQDNYKRLGAKKKNHKNPEGLYSYIV